MKKTFITVFLTTCDRYDTTFPLSLLSILNQTRLPDKILIVDDSKKKEFYNNSIVKQLLTLANWKKVPIDYLHGESKGQVPALRLGLNEISDGWVYKMDDDNILESNVLEIFEKNIDDSIGGMSGVILDKSALSRTEGQIMMSSKIEDIYSHFNIQMVGIQSSTPKEVEHIYSNYFFRRDLAGYWPEQYEPSSHREDTTFTYQIFRKGYKLVVFPEVIIYHMNNGEKTGNRQYGKEYTDNNEKVFLKKLEEWSVIPDKLQIYEDSKRIYTTKNKTNYVIIEK